MFRNPMPFHELWWPRSETNLTAHVWGKSFGCYWLLNYISVTIVLHVILSDCYKYMYYGNTLFFSFTITLLLLIFKRIKVARPKIALRVKQIVFVIVLGRCTCTRSWLFIHLFCLDLGKPLWHLQMADPRACLDS